MLNQLAQNVCAIDNKLGTIFSTPSAPTSLSSLQPIPTIPAQEPDLRPSEIFDGDIDSCGGFLLQCNLAFSHTPYLFPTHAAKITYILSSLKGRAFRWAKLYSLHTHHKQSLLNCLLKNSRLCLIIRSTRMQPPNGSYH